jgi:Mrp family chromosome partitioning ATPase
MSEQFDLVLVDSAPVNLISDTQLLAGCCDAVLLVARAFSTTRKSMEQAVQELSPFRIIGTVLNGGPRAHNYRRYKGYY